MTKSLKSLHGRAFTTSTGEEFISGRQIAAVVQPARAVPPVELVQPVDLLGTEKLLQGDDSLSAALGKAGGESFGSLPCCLSCGKDVSGAHQHSIDRSLGGDSISLPPTILDEGTLTVVVGGSVTGVIDSTGDADLITVDLVAGQTYLISLVGTGATPVTDTFLTVNAPNGSFINDDDDGGVGTFSLMTITAAVSGTYQIIAESFSNPGDPGLGEYTVTVIQQGADEAPDIPPPDVPYAIGTTAYGFINPAGDADIYQVTLTAGMVYTFSVAAGADYNTDFTAVPAGEVDTIIEIFDANGNLIASGDDINFPDDISSSAGALIEETGTYYVRVSGYPGQSGGYTLVSEDSTWPTSARSTRSTGSAPTMSTSTTSAACRPPMSISRGPAKASAS